MKAGVPKAPPRTIEYRSYKSFNTDDFNHELHDVPWHIVENENKIDDAVYIWNKLFSEVADAHAPIKKRRVKSAPPPWMNGKISEAKRDRDYNHGKRLNQTRLIIGRCTKNFEILLVAKYNQVSQDITVD